MTSKPLALTNIGPSGTFSPLEDPSINSNHVESESSNVSFLIPWNGYHSSQTQAHIATNEVIVIKTHVRPIGYVFVSRSHISELPVDGVQQSLAVLVETLNLIVGNIEDLLYLVEFIIISHHGNTQM